MSGTNNMGLSLETFKGEATTLVSHKLNTLQTPECTPFSNANSVR